jgi:hypothetical protein
MFKPSVSERRQKTGVTLGNPSPNRGGHRKAQFVVAIRSSEYFFIK